MSRKKFLRRGYHETFEAAPPAPAPEQPARAFRPEKKPLTPLHLAYMQAIRDRLIVLAVSPAGCGKTSLACEVGVEMLRRGAIGNLVITRPLAQCDEDLGTLKGDLKEKMDPYVAPMMVLLSEMLGRAKLEKMLRSGEVEIVPLGVMRGRTFHDSFVVLDEAQNATFGQLKMALSRLGQNSKMVVNGDVEQCDLRRESPLKEVWRLLSGPGAHPNIGFAKMGTAEQLRPEIVNFITERLSGR